MILVLDAYDANGPLLNNKDLCQQVLLDAARRTGMHVIRDNGVMRYDDPARPLDGGITGDVWIAESHIAIHTWPHRRYFHFLLDSCRDFDADDLATYVCQFFGAQRADKVIVDAGLYSAIRKGALPEEVTA